MTPVDAFAQDVSLWTIRPSAGELGEVPLSTRTELPPPPPSTTADAPPARGRELVFAPLPLINPTLDNGLALFVGALYPLSANAPPSATFLGGLATSNGSWGAAAGQTLHLAGDRYRVIAAGSYFDVNFDFFGIGSDAGASGLSIPLNQRGTMGLGEFLTRIGGRWYAGARYRLMSTHVSSDVAEPTVPIPEADIELRTALLGPRVELDTRDSPFYPTRGGLIDGLVQFAGESIGGRRAYQIYQLSVASYVGFGERHVVASRVNMCGASDRTPFFDLCLIGQYQDLRGYPTGQYRDKAMLTGQAEYRIELPWRLGLVGFGGVGSIADSFSNLSTNHLLPSVGGGVRFRLTRDNHLNLRADYAWGRDSQALYVSVGEAF